MATQASKEELKNYVTNDIEQEEYNNKQQQENNISVRVPAETTYRISVDKEPFIKFYKISSDRAQIDNLDLYLNYNNIKLPKRATTGSAGYDFYAPFNITIDPGQTKKIPTGIRIKLTNSTVLLIFPRSSLGFKYKLKLDNTVGVIDSDYFNSDNEGHIWVSMTNMGDRTVNIKKGEAFCQGIITSFYVTDDDNTTEERNGGFGSTNK